MSQPFSTQAYDFDAAIAASTGFTPQHITHHENKKVYFANLDNRELITSVEFIYARGFVIAPMIIIAGKALIEKHLDNNMDDNVLFVISDTGYVNSGLSLKWLKHFERLTSLQKRGKWRMPTYDGHASHVDNDILFYAWTKEMTLSLLSSHTTHLLQPLHIGIFQPMKHWHEMEFCLGIFSS